MNHDTDSTARDGAAACRYRVLLAEDCDSSRLALEMCLRHAGCEPHAARNGRQALDFFVANPFDMVLMDLEMPDMDGHEVAACIRAMERERNLPPTPIIALTAHDDPAHREVCRQTGFDGYMVKPANTETLRRMVAALCRTPVANAT